MEVLPVAQSFMKYGVDTSNLLTEEGFYRTDPRFGDWDGFFTAVLRTGG